jgi:hypothetical protein
VIFSIRIQYKNKRYKVQYKGNKMRATLRNGIVVDVMFFERPVMRIKDRTTGTSRWEEVPKEIAKINKFPGSDSIVSERTYCTISQVVNERLVRGGKDNYRLLVAAAATRNTKDEPDKTLARKLAFEKAIRLPVFGEKLCKTERRVLINALPPKWRKAWYPKYPVNQSEMDILAMDKAQIEKKEKARLRRLQEA